MKLVHLFLLMTIIEVNTLQCPYSTSYTGPANNGVNSCFKCINISVTTNNSLCRTCDPITRTVGNLTGSNDTCPCWGMEISTSCYPFNTTFIPAIELVGNNVTLSWRHVENFNIGNGTKLSNVTGYRISVEFENQLIFTETIPSEIEKLNYTLSYSFPRSNASYILTTEIEALINNYQYFGRPFSQTIMIEATGTVSTTLTQSTLSPGVESVIITSGVALLIVFILLIVFVFLCTVFFPYRLCKRREPFTLNLEPSNARLQRVVLDLNDGFSTVHGDIQMEGLAGKNVEQGEMTYFINPYLVEDGQSKYSGSFPDDQ